MLDGGLVVNFDEKKISVCYEAGDGSNYWLFLNSYKMLYKKKKKIGDLVLTCDVVK